MELYISRLLKQIKICDNIATVGDSLEDAALYNKMLNILLANLTTHLKSDFEKESFKELDFANLQLTIQKYKTFKIFKVP